MADKNLEKAVERLKKKLVGAKSLVILTGAGISAESGVPTFRGKDGLWKQYQAMDLATPGAFNRDSKLVWEFYNWRREVLAPLAPNAAHKALVEFEKRVSRFTLITQNIDGLHQTAGSRNVLELHGNIWWVRCTGCGVRYEDRAVPLSELPRCRDCQGLLRPNVVWFGETLDSNILDSAFHALETADVMMVIGTSGTVQPAASLGMAAKRAGAVVAEINLDPTPYTGVYDVSLTGKAGEIVPLLL